MNIIKHQVCIKPCTKLEQQREKWMKYKIEDDVWGEIGYKIENMIWEQVNYQIRIIMENE